MYVLEIAKNGLLEAFINGDWTGALIRVTPDGTRTEIAPGSLFAPGGVAIGSDGAPYVTNNSIFSGSGQVLRIELWCPDSKVRVTNQSVYLRALVFGPSGTKCL